MKVSLLCLLMTEITMLTFFSEVISQNSDTDKIINNEAINRTYPYPDDKDPPDYSIFLQIDVKKNSSAYNSDFVIVDNTGIRVPDTISIDVPISKDLIRKIRTLDAKKLLQFLQTV